MENNNFTISFVVDQSPMEVFQAINNVRGWWSETLEGVSDQLQGIFSYRHGDIHYSKHQVTELVPGKRVVWHTLDSKLTFVNKQQEWNGTHMIFEISPEAGQTKLQITHAGLVPAFECYEGCSKGWTYYLQNSLLPLIVTGKGNPDRKPA